MKILKPGDPCPCCGQPIPDGLPTWNMLVLGYIAEGMAIKDMLDASKAAEGRSENGQVPS